MRKSLDEESIIGDAGAGEDAGGVKGGVEGKGDKPVEVVPKLSGKVVPRIRGSSITLDGSGDHSGRDADNSMSLGDFYEVILCR